MNKENLTPDPPELFKVSEELQAKRDKWVQYLRNLSERIIVLLPCDKKFDYKDLELKTKGLIEYHEPKEIILSDWPKLERIAFMVCWNSSLPEHKPKYVAEDCYLFCYGDVAFGLRYYEQYEMHSERSIVDNCVSYSYGLGNFIPEALSWKYIAKLIRDRMIEIQEEIKGSPPSPD